MPSPILARADALMHRKRPNEAGYEDVPILTDAIGDDDDIPVLLEVAAVPPEAAPIPPAPVEALAAADDTVPEMLPAVSEEPAPSDTPLWRDADQDAALREQLANELARRVEQRLSAELPRIIESTLREFLTEQEMIAAASPRD